MQKTYARPIASTDCFLLQDGLCFLPNELFHDHYSYAQEHRWRLMAISLSNNQVRLLRMRAQRLTPQQTDAVASVAHIVKEVCGLQAQDALAATLGVRVRSAGLVAADV